MVVLAETLGIIHKLVVLEALQQAEIRIQQVVMVLVGQALVMVVLAQMEVLVGQEEALGKQAQPQEAEEAEEIVIMTQAMELLEELHLPMNLL